MEGHCCARERVVQHSAGRKHGDSVPCERFDEVTCRCVKLGGRLWGSSYEVLGKWCPVIFIAITGFCPAACGLIHAAGQKWTDL